MCKFAEGVLAIRFSGPDILHRVRGARGWAVSGGVGVGFEIEIAILGWKVSEGVIMGTGESPGSVRSAWLHPAADIPSTNNRIAATFGRAVPFHPLGPQQVEDSVRWDRVVVCHASLSRPGEYRVDIYAPFDRFVP